jgi:hypothetical protein
LIGTGGKQYETGPSSTKNYGEGLFRGGHGGSRLIYNNISIYGWLQHWFFKRLYALEYKILKAYKSLKRT